MIWTGPERSASRRAVGGDGMLWMSRRLFADCLDMSPETEQPTTVLERYEDLVAEYAGEADLPVDWLTRLHLERPIQTLHEMSGWTRAVKRTLDVVGSLAAISILAPVGLLAALAVRLSSAGPVVYHQIRVGLNRRTGLPERRRRHRTARLTTEGSNGVGDGRDRRSRHSFGKPFVIYKFRTMVKDAEKHGARLASANDPRITPVGRILRRTRLDEILQFVNVLRGEMTLVGPRPERPEFVSNLSRQIPGYLDRLGLKPGITGLAQVINGYDEGLESVRRKVALDLLYLQNACIRNDLKILLRTVKVVITGHGAR